MNRTQVTALASVLVLAATAAGCSTGTSGTPERPTIAASAPASATTEPTLSPPPADRPALTETFTSTIHGISVSYPAGWLIAAATDPWTTSYPPLFQDQVADHLYDGSLTDHLFLGLSAQPLAGNSAARWAEDLMAFDGCRPMEAVTIDGASGLIGDNCTMATVANDGRGYLITLYASRDEPQVTAMYDRAWFMEVLATVRLHPEDAVDAAPSASP